MWACQNLYMQASLRVVFCLFVFVDFFFFCFSILSVGGWCICNPPPTFYHTADSWMKSHFNILFSLTYMYAGESGVDLDVLSTGTENFQRPGELDFHFKGMLSPRYYNNSKQRFHNRLPTRTSIPPWTDTAAAENKRKILPVPLNRRFQSLQ